MSKKTVQAPDGTVVAICAYTYTDVDGHVDTCRAHAKCPVCGQCSKISDGKEHGHCTGHLGLKQDILDGTPNRGTV